MIWSLSSYDSLLVYKWGVLCVNDGVSLCFLNHLIHVRPLFPQTNHLGRIYSLSDWDAGLRFHPQPGSPVGGVYHSWSFRVGNHYRGKATEVVNITARA